jgi:hypothetical protein
MVRQIQARIQTTPPVVSNQNSDVVVLPQVEMSVFRGDPHGVGHLSAEQDRPRFPE